MGPVEHDILDGLLGFEDKFYTEGYDLGANDGAYAGYTEGSVFAVEKSFERFLEMGRLYGKVIVWAKRLPAQHDLLPPTNTSLSFADISYKQETESQAKSTTGSVTESAIWSGPFPDLPELRANSRLAKHIKTLFNLVDPLALSVENTEEAVSDFGERLKKASAKVKVIEKILAEFDGTASQPSQNSKRPSGNGGGAGNIEDVGLPPARFS